MDERQTVYKKIIDRIVAVLGEGDYSESTEYANLGLKSANFSQMITYLEDECDVEIPFMEFRRKRTIGESLDYIMSLIEG